MAKNQLKGVSKELAGIFNVNIPAGQSLVRGLPSIGRVDFSDVSLARAEALNRLGVKVLVKVEVDADSKLPPSGL